ncbi:MAG: imidazole glycerol phosphate synthase subunit HisH [Thermodesulfovibrionales bacterium]|nr:imidazole glycerol phosphate synthase subunit HisH [Thermodesulfovibrionales bacterium]
MDISHSRLQVGVIDYGMGNLFSVKRACEYVGLKAVVTADKSTIMNSDGIILPGVGAFGDAMDILKRKDLIFPIRDFVEMGKPFMGICLGMQLLLSESEEFGCHKGLDIIKGTVVRFVTNEVREKGLKIPHIGWNRLSLPYPSPENFWKGTLLDGLTSGEFMYFTHSYYPVLADEKTVLCTTIYGDVTFASGIIYKNINAFQFHPEKSGERGLHIYKNLRKQMEMVRDASA